MNTQTATREFLTQPVSGDVADRTMRPDTDCWARATEFLSKLFGSPPADLRWDDTHHLQGHGHVRGRELIVIAPRDDDHQTVVLTAEDWEAVRRASTDQRRSLLEASAIVNRKKLVAVLRDRRQLSGSLNIAA